MPTLKARLFSNYDWPPDDVQRGDYSPAPDNKGVFMCCPGCGAKSAPHSKSTHRYDPATSSVTPSIVHDANLGGCGWHGWLKNGEFTW